MAGAISAGAAIMGAGALGAGASLAGAGKNAKAASSAQASQERMAGADLAFRQAQYNRYLGLMGPIEQQLSTEAQSSQPLDYDKNKAAIAQNYGNTQRQITNAMGMRGMAGSGMDVGAMRGAAMGQAGEMSNAYSTGLMNRRNLGLSLTGRGQIQNAASGVMGGMQNMANLYGQQAGMYNQAAGQGYAGFGQGLQSMANAYGRYQYNQPQGAPAYDGMGYAGNPGSGVGAQQGMAGYYEGGGYAAPLRGAQPGTDAGAYTPYGG